MCVLECELFDCLVWVCIMYVYAGVQVFVQISQNCAHTTDRSDVNFALVLAQQLVTHIVYCASVSCVYHRLTIEQ